MSGPVHYKLEILFDTLFQPLCQNQRGRDAFRGRHLRTEMTADETQVTCAECLKALGFEPCQTCGGMVQYCTHPLVPYSPVRFDVDPESDRPRFAA